MYNNLIIKALDFNQFRAKTGSYDVRDIEEISRSKAETFDLSPIRMKAAPKFSGSVESRVRLTIANLQADQILISAQCTNIYKMFQNLISEKPGKHYDPNIAFKPKRSVYIHAFDAMSYPILHYNSTPVFTTASISSEIMNIGA